MEEQKKKPYKLPPVSLSELAEKKIKARKEKRGESYKFIINNLIEKNLKP